MVETLSACHECDLLQLLPDVPGLTQAKCARCGAEMHQHQPLDHEKPLALMLAVTILFILANSFPIIAIETAGLHQSATILGAVQSLWQENMKLVAGLVLFTTLIAPGLEILALTALLVCLQFKLRPSGLRTLMRIAVRSRPWSMVEVFVMGVLVSVVKLSHLAQIYTGIALWSYGLLILLFAGAMTLVNPQALWAEIKPDE
ncbi:MAG: hypothetical protein RLZ25_884 [Pseudomonadota bacterium]|jgi:paraquat-inducible protein A